MLKMEYFIGFVPYSTSSIALDLGFLFYVNIMCKFGILMT